MGTREELHVGNFGVMTCLMSLTDFQVTFLAKVVPERGEALWLRFRAWQRDGHTDEGFTAWVDSLTQAVLTAQFQPQPIPVPSRPQRRPTRS